MHWGNSLLGKNNKKRCINTEKEISLMEKKLWSEVIKSQSQHLSSQADEAKAE